MTKEPLQTIPSGYELRMNDPGTALSAWVLGAEYDGIGFAAEATFPVSTVAPGDDVAAWAAEHLEVTGVTFSATAIPHTWSIEIAY